MTTEILERYGWWAALNHGGLLIAPSKLAEAFPETLPDMDRTVVDRLRRALVRVEAGGEDATPAFLDVVLEDVLGLDRAHWRKGSGVDQSWSRPAVTGEVVRPARVWLGPHGVVLPVFYLDASTGGLKGGAGLRLGLGKGRRIVSRVIEWLRKSDHKIALVTTGRQFRLVHAGPDYDAFCEWDTALWFQEGAPGAQLVALRALLSPDAVVPPGEGNPSRLLAAIQASRQGQAELSQALGERVRQAVELLIGASSEALAAIDAEAGGPASTRAGGHPTGVSRRDIYIASTRIVMRCVIILFAEARELLPRNNDIYESSYGLQSLRVQLDRLAGGRAAERLRTSHAAWPRLLSLFSLVSHGSAHPGLPIPRYAGGLFAPSNPTSPDPLLRALAAFEGPRNAPSDAVIHRMLELLCRTKVKVRQGRSSRVVEAPVDFSDLSSEYIGILYEGLLDFELRRVAEDDVVVFLNLGDQPALPFQRLNDMSNDDLAELLSKLKKSKKKNETEDAVDEDEEEEEAEDDAEETEDELVDGPETQPEETDEADDRFRVLRQYVQDWAERAVKAAKLVKYPRNDTDARVRDQFSRDVSARARELVQRLVLPGEWFLVRWGGTRKGSGTFYTRPQIAGPTVRRALQPLAFVQTSGASDGPVTWAPRKPEEILALKVCDPAMGSGSFLVSALRYFTDALHQSLHHHGRLEARPDGTVCRLADGATATHLGQELLPVPPDHPEFEDRLRARLKRHVVERCVYGVDLDPLAVELARTSLWVETMDRELPFGFLDHKLKCGNSLVGCWFDRFQDYPILAWEREGGDKDHQPVHHFRESVVSRGKSKGQTKRTGDKWTSAIKDTRNDVIKPDLISWLTQQSAKAAGQVVADFAVEGRSADDLHREALEIFEELHAIVPISDAERRADVYAEKITGSPALQRLRLALDTWCALWFWPAEHVKDAPKPSDLLNPNDAALARVRRLAREHRFFHWEFEFPDVFRTSGSGFDAIVGNPPWEIQKPNSMEYFSNIDPLYRTYGKQEALKKQQELFSNAPEIERAWVEYCARLKAMSNWTKNTGFPFGKEGDQGSDLSLSRGKAGSYVVDAWREMRQARKGYGDREHPFRHQGSADINTYKMFLETAHALLQAGGRLGFLVPSGLYSDNGSQALRELLLDRCRWTHLYAFQNERFIFEGIHHSFKMAVVHVRKGGKTDALLTKFRLGPGDSPEAQAAEQDLDRDGGYLALAISTARRFSPISGTLLELSSDRDVAILERLYERGLRLGAPESQFKYATEFHTANDSRLFPPRPTWEAQGYACDEYGHWLQGNWREHDRLQHPESGKILSGDGARAIDTNEITGVAVPFYEGRMINAFDYSEKGWVEGRGRKAVWRDIPWSEKTVEPQFLMDRRVWLESTKSYARPKVAYMRVSATTNTRTMIATCLAREPAGDSIFFYRHSLADLTSCLLLAGAFNSFGFDYVMRLRLGGQNLSEYIVNDQLIPDLWRNPQGDWLRRTLAWQVARLCLASTAYAHLWLQLLPLPGRAWKHSWALREGERLRLRCNLDAIFAHLYGLREDDLSWILRECDHPVTDVCDKPFSRTLEPKGFWRVDKNKPPELRHTVLVLVAFHELQKVGLDAFLAMNEGDGWMLPETLRLADYGLGHDDRAKVHQPVAAALGPRFLPWQLEQSVEESWAECRRHADLMAKILPPPPVAAMPDVPQPGAARDAVTEQTDLFGEPVERDLFGNPVQRRKPRKKR